MFLRIHFFEASDPGQVALTPSLSHIPHFRSTIKLTIFRVRAIKVRPRDVGLIGLAPAGKLAGVFDFRRWATTKPSPEFWKSP